MLSGDRLVFAPNAEPFVLQIVKLEIDWRLSGFREIVLDCILCAIGILSGEIRGLRQKWLLLCYLRFVFVDIFFFVGVLLLLYSIRSHIIATTTGADLQLLVISSTLLDLLSLWSVGCIGELIRHSLFGRLGEAVETTSQLLLRLPCHMLNQLELNMIMVRVRSR